MTVPLWAWVAFGAVVVVMLAIDLLAHRGAHVIKFKEAAVWSAVWVGLSLVFAVVVTLTLGGDAGVQFTTSCSSSRLSSATSRCRASTSTGCCSSASSVP